jgi:hypothetical protein
MVFNSLVFRQLQQPIVTQSSVCHFIRQKGKLTPAPAPAPAPAVPPLFVAGLLLAAAA